MFNFGMERSPRAPTSPVESQLAGIEKFEKDFWRLDDYIYRVRTYLEYAKKCGLGSQAVVDSCVDLAETYTSIPELAERRQAKLDAWNKARAAALEVDREPIEINMELDPIYFEAILRGEKTYEGRAYKPDSDKDYPSIRRGDSIRFRLSNREEGFAEDAISRGLRLDRDMECKVKEVHFAPTVHGIYQIPRFNGLGFQPMISGPGEIIQLQRAAVYHTFPGYHELISEHGFLGIEVEDPKLVAA
jgi:hypothetical protein